MSAALVEYRVETVADTTETATMDLAALNAHAMKFGVMRTKTTKFLLRQKC